MTGREHSRLLGIFFLVQGGLQVFGGLIMFLIYGGLGAFMMSQSRRSEEQAMGGIFIIVAIVVAAFVLLFAGFSLLTGWKLFKQQQSARIWGIIASCLVLLGFPLGTALGIYGLWFFFGEAGKQYYRGIGDASNNFPPPPPNNWQ